MALIIMIISLVSVFALFGAASASHRRALAAQNAAHLASSILAELEQLPNPGAVPDIADQTHAAFEGYRYDVAFRQLNANEVEAVVTIRWKRSGRDESEVYRTILLRR
ncbi:MAG: hypothetical protein HUU15_06515 [Candidatus Brocadiae bacterium]|nr:hypothetical protein [Candidatus Brocadiia bacterium]